MIGADDRIRVQQFLEQLRTHAEVPGISIALSVDGDRYAACSGVSNTQTGTALTPEARFAPGCLTKLLTSLVAHMLACRGALDLQTPIARYLPELSGPSTEHMSPGHLLSHSAGYRGENFLDADVLLRTSWEDFAASFGRRSMLFEPGTVYDYSQSAYVVIGKIIERITGRRLRDLVREEILDPLEIVVDCAGSRSPETYASGHLFNATARRLAPLDNLPLCDFWADSLLGPPLTPLQFVRIVAALVEGAAPFDRRIAAALMRPVVFLPLLFGGSRREDVPVASGMGWVRFTEHTYGISSSMPGEVCSIRVHPQRKIVVAVGINSHQPFTRDFLAKKLMNAFLPQDTLQPVATQVAEGFELAELAGAFHGRLQTSFQASLKDRQLTLRTGHNPATSLGTLAQPIVLAEDGAGRLVPKTDLQFLSLGFFRAPGSNTPCFMIGDSVYRKVVAT
jgi:CubicO group peptidase (beta-lactamase class C family)